MKWQATGKDQFSVYHDDQAKYRNHWGIAATIPPEASAIQVTPTSFVNVSKWTRTHTSRLLFEAGYGYYSQEYTELYQPSVTGQSDKVWDLNAIRNSRTYTVIDQSNNQTTQAWNSPADHFSVVRTFMGAASYVTGSHNLRFGTSYTNGDWRLVEAYTGDVQPITYSFGRPVSVTLRLPNDMSNGIKRDFGLFVQDRWAMGRVTLNLGLRYDNFVGETRESSVLPNRFTFSPLANGVTYGECADGKAGRDCYGEVQNWKDLSPRVGFAWDVFGTGRTAVRASAARYVAGQAVGVARQVNPVEALTRSDPRPWTNDIDGNGFPLAADGTIQFNEFGTSTSTPTFGRNVSTTSYDPEVLNGWFKRGFNFEWTVAAQHQLADRVSINGGYFRRTFGNQTFTDDLRYDESSYDSFCINAPADPRLPYGNGGGYQVCGVQDLKPSVFALNLPANNLIRFSKDVGGETNLYQGFDFNIEGRFRNGAFLKAGIGASSRTFDICNLSKAGLDAFRDSTTQLTTAQGTEIYPDGTRACHRDGPLSSGCEALRLVHTAVRHHPRRHVSVQPGRADGRCGTEHPGELCDSECVCRGTWRAPVERRRVAYRPVDSRRPDVRRSQLEPARFETRQAILLGPLPRAVRLRHLQRVQQQLALHRELHVRDCADEPVAATDERAPEPILQGRREVRLLEHGGTKGYEGREGTKVTKGAKDLKRITFTLFVACASAGPGAQHARHVIPAVPSELLERPVTPRTGHRCGARRCGHRRGRCAALLRSRTRLSPLLCVD